MSELPQASAQTETRRTAQSATVFDHIGAARLPAISAAAGRRVARAYIYAAPQLARSPASAALRMCGAAGYRRSITVVAVAGAPTCCRQGH